MLKFLFVLDVCAALVFVFFYFELKIKFSFFFSFFIFVSRGGCWWNILDNPPPPLWLYTLLFVIAFKGLL